MELLGFTAANLLRLAVVVNELEDRGEDLKSIRMGLLPILRKIAAGELLPDIVVMYAGQPAVIRQIARVPVEEQRGYLSGKVFPSEPKRQQPATTPAERQRDAIVAARQEATSGPDNFAAMIAKATPKDIGATAASMIAECGDPKEAMIAFKQEAVRLGVMLPT